MSLKAESQNESTNQKANKDIIHWLKTSVRLFLHFYVVCRQNDVRDNLDSQINDENNREETEAECVAHRFI